MVWQDEHWVVQALAPSGSPLVLLLRSRSHYDFSTLPDDLAGELGVLLVRIAAGVEALPSVARAHVSRWGDGAAHLHVFVIARPMRLPQLRGTCMAIWDDVLPPVPRSVRDDNARFVVSRLVAAYGDSEVGPAAGNPSAGG